MIKFLSGNTNFKVGVKDVDWFYKFPLNLTYSTIVVLRFALSISR